MFFARSVSPLNQIRNANATFIVIYPFSSLEYEWLHRTKLDSKGRNLFNISQPDASTTIVMSATVGYLQAYAEKTRWKPTLGSHDATKKALQDTSWADVCSPTPPT